MLLFQIIFLQISIIDHGTAGRHLRRLDTDVGPPPAESNEVRPAIPQPTVPDPAPHVFTAGCGTVGRHLRRLSIDRGMPNRPPPPRGVK